MMSSTTSATSLPKSFHFHEKIDHSWVSALCADDACFLRERTRDDDRNASDHRDYAITTVAKSKCGGQDIRKDKILIGGLMILIGGSLVVLGVVAILSFH